MTPPSPDLPPSEARKPGRLLVAANRLPLSLSRTAEGWVARPSTGGLVTALHPALQERGGTWIGWPGVAAEEGDGWRDVLAEGWAEQPYDLVPVPLSERDVEEYYAGFSNEVLWPLFHGMLSRCRFRPRYWAGYQRINQRFAEAIASRAVPGDLVWVHDYHLLLVAKYLRAMGVRARLGLFLHIPFPPLDTFIRLPWRAELLRGLMSFDLVGLQTARDARSVGECMGHLVPEARTTLHRTGALSVAEHHHVRVDAFPIGIDADLFADLAAGSAVQRRIADLRSESGDLARIIGVDRLDYSKGIPQRLRAFRQLLADNPELLGRVTLVQLVVPSREGVAEYRDLKDEIDRLVGEVNGRFGRPGWTPIAYLYRRVPREELVALYRDARVALVTPLADGMNLVAKEYCACQGSDPGVLILSEFAGAAAQLERSALLVNPYDIEGVAAALRRALDMSHAERQGRMELARSCVHDEDVHHWLRSFLDEAAGAGGAEREVAEYLPEVQLEVPH